MKKITDYESTAMLGLSDEERSIVEERYNSIVDGFAILDSYDTDGVEPAFTVLKLKNVMREDVVASNMTRDEVLANAPEQNDGYFQVPAAIE